jgi:hypothetical protein
MNDSPTDTGSTNDLSVEVPLRKAVFSLVVRFVCLGAHLGAFATSGLEFGNDLSVFCRDVVLANGIDP